MDKVAFMPFSYLVDKWRWGVFDGSITPANYNQAWVDLKREYQGIVPPVPRSGSGLRSGRQVPHPGQHRYARYFLARVLQFQFYKAACDMSGWKGPLHRCSFYGNKEVGARLNQMLAMGASQALARRAAGVHRHPRDFRQADARIFRAAAGVAGAAERRQAVRLVIG